MRTVFATWVVFVHLAGCLAEPEDLDVPGGVLSAEHPAAATQSLVQCDSGLACSTSILIGGSQCEAGSLVLFCCPPGSVIFNGGACSGPPRIFVPNCPAPCDGTLHIGIPDNSATGVRVPVEVSPGIRLARVAVDVNIAHTFRGDLIVQVIAPTGQLVTLSNRQGGSADNFVVTDKDISSSFALGGSASGQWQLFVRDLAAADTGTVSSFALRITPTE